MPLTKAFDVVFTPGQPGHPASAAHQYCTGTPPMTAPPPGHYERRCEDVEIPAYTIGGEGGFVVYQTVNICRDVWVPY